MDYFELENKQETEFRFIYDRTDTSEYFISKQAEEIKDFNESSLQHLNVKVEQDIGLSNDLQLEGHEFEEKLLDTNTLVSSNNNQLDPLVDKPPTGSLPICRLCAQEVYDEEMTYLHETSTDDTTTIVDKINACLPISVSLEDSLPKQICAECLVNVESSYIFSICVTAAEEKLRSFQFCSNAENMNCPLCCEGCMEAVPPDTNLEDESSDDFSQLQEKIYVKYVQNLNEHPEETTVNPSISSNLKRKKRGRPRRAEYAHLDQDDKDWTIDDEVEPARKRRATNRGRPKGSRNRIAKLINMDCFICHSKFNEFEEALPHALSAHCDSANETFPCPLCQSITTSEQELRDHIDTHNDKKEVLVIRCNLCGMEFGKVTNLHQHVIKMHAISAKFRCPLCEFKELHPGSVLAHVFQDHLNATEREVATCPVCALGFQSGSEAREHFAENHNESANTLICPECDSELESVEGYLNHFVEAHCTTSTFRVPSSYCCCVCGNNFRSQYHLIKHTCSVVTEELFCSECDKGFPTKARFVFHLQIRHSAVRDMRCDECLLVFSDEDAFYDHVRFQHEPDEQVQCQICRKAFKNAVSLSMHMRRHQPNRDHSCEECGKRFQNAQTLREHLVSHMSVKPFQCHICGAYLSRLSRLRIHLRTHSVKASKASMKAYKCSVCTQLFPNTKVAIKHSESHMDVESINLEELEVNLVFRCEFCDAFFQKTSELNAHRKKYHSNPHAPNAFTCSVCGAQFSTYARVTTHKLSHGINTETLIVPDQVNKGEESFVIPQYFLCHECDKRCLHYTYMSLHRRFQHSSGKPIFTCTVCGDKFATSWSLQFHRKKQHNLADSKDIICEGVNSLFHCQVCDKPYVTETSLEHHIRKFHENDDCDDAGSNYICETCGKTFQFKSALDAHTDAHRGLKRFKCNVCDKRFTHRAGLIRHMKLHSETDTFECEFCGKKFRDRTERENHRRAHTGERPFMCDVCGRTFHTRAVWLDHSRIHQDMRPYQCDICSQSFRRSYALKSHYLIHTGERPFSCEDCGKTFRLKQTLFAHRKKEHQNDDSGPLILPDEVLLTEEDSQYVDELPGVETDCESLIGKNYIDSELVDNPEAPTTSSVVERSHHWDIDPKHLMNKTVSEGRSLMKGVKSAQPFQQQKYSLLLKSQPINNDGLR